MFYSFYQKKTLSYFIEKIKLGKKNHEKSDIQKLNLKGKIKSYTLISSNENIDIIESITFNENGNFITHNKKGNFKIYQYNENTKLKKCETFENEDKLILTEYFKYDTEKKLISKETLDELNFNNNYSEYYEYDLRKNLTAIIKLYDLDDIIQTNKYNNYGQLTDSFYFTNKIYNGRSCEKFKNVYGGKFKTITQYSSENDVITEKNSILNDNGDTIAELFHNSLNYLYRDNPTSTLNFIYKYDKYDNWITKTEYYNGDLKEELTTKIEYY